MLKTLMGLVHALLSKDNEVPCRQILQNLRCLYLGMHMCLFSIKNVFKLMVIISCFIINLMQLKDCIQFLYIIYDYAYFN